MPICRAFPKTEQSHLSLLALAHRGSLEKLRGKLLEHAGKTGSSDGVTAGGADLPQPGRCRVARHEGRFSGTKFHLVLAPGWLVQNPLTEAALLEEMKQWKDLGVSMQVVEG